MKHIMHLCYVNTDKQKLAKMKSLKTNAYNLQIGDTIEFVNSVNYKVVKTITGISEKAVFCNSKESWNTFNGYIKKYNATIIRLNP